jgi:hypothetical protein
MCPSGAVVGASLPVTCTVRAGTVRVVAYIVGTEKGEYGAKPPFHALIRSAAPDENGRWVTLCGLRVQHRWEDVPWAASDLVCVTCRDEARRLAAQTT